MAEILDGKQFAASLREPLAQRAAALTARGCRPGLAVIRVGDDPASEIYVRNKARMCQRLGLFSIELHLPVETSEERLTTRSASRKGDACQKQERSARKRASSSTVV